MNEVCPDGGVTIHDNMPDDIALEHIDVLNSEAYLLRSNERSRALEMCEQALAAARRLHYTRGIADATLNKGILETYASRNDKAFYLFLEAQHLYENIGDKRGLATALRWIGVMYTRIGGTIVALEYFLKSRSIGDELGDIAHIALCTVNIGGAHSGLGDYYKAFDCFSQAHELQTYDDKPLEKAMLLWNTGRAYEGLGNYAEALSCFRQSLDLRQLMGDDTGAAASMFALGDIYRKTNHPVQALRCYGVSLRECDKAKFLWGEAMCNTAIGALYTACNKVARAQEYLNIALIQAEEVQSKETLCNVHRELAECYRMLGDMEQAYEHLLKFHTVKEELSTDQIRHTVAYIRYSHEAEMVQREAEIYRLKNNELAEAYSRLSDTFEEVKVLNDHLSTVNGQLRELNNEKSELLGIVSHDLKNPLTSIILSTSVLKRYFDRAIPETALREIDKVEYTARRMNETVRRLLDLNAIETGVMRILPEPCDVVAAAVMVAEEYSNRAQQKEISLYVEPTVPAALAFADKTAVNSVFDNLISNAVKFSPKKSSVYVHIGIAAPQETQAPGKIVRIEVKDEGPGINAEDKVRLFGKFSRLSAMPTDGEHSTGLGLSIVQKLVTAMNGFIRYEDRERGGAFVVELPLCEDEQNTSRLDD